MAGSLTSAAVSAERMWTLPDTGGTVQLRTGSGTSVLGSSPIASGSCATVVNTLAPGTVSTDTIAWSFAAAPTSTDGLLSYPWFVAADAVNWKVCNPTAGTLTPSGLTVNWRVLKVEISAVSSCWSSSGRTPEPAPSRMIDNSYLVATSSFSPTCWRHMA